MRDKDLPAEAARPRTSDVAALHRASDVAAHHRTSDVPANPRASDVAALAAMFKHGPAALLTGAGVSTDSGIPDYRGAGSPPRRPMRIDQFMHDEEYRKRFWAGARAAAPRMLEIKPNPAHFAVAQLERAGLLTGVITQNVDGLHGRAGSTNLSELHGNGSVIRCVESGHRFGRREVLQWFDVANPGYAEANLETELRPDSDAEVSDFGQVRVPMCPACGGVLRPDVVYFGEHVPTEVFRHAERIVASAESIIIAGSSLAVNTSIRLVHRAEQRDLPIGIINRGPTAIDSRASVAIRIDSGTTETLTALAELLAG